MKRSRGLLLCLLPLLLGLLLSLALTQNWLPNRVLVAQFSMDLVALTTQGGFLLSLVALIGWGLFRWHTQQLQSAHVQSKEQAAKDHKLFVQRLDHEIKNPLTIMQLGIVNILNQATLNDDERHSMERMQTQVNRLRQLVMDLRSLTELEDRVVERNRIALETVLENAIDTATANTPKRQIDLTIQRVPWPVGAIIGDTDLLTIAFTNLLNNALKFTAEEGAIRVQITDNGQYAVVEVADNGIGIPSVEVARVFDELYRASNAARIAGSGMGLALVKRIVALHHGEVSIHSREGHGTSIAVQLPLANKS